MKKMFDASRAANHVILAVMICLASVMSFLPFVLLPFSWIATFFHEISHGIAALLTGGSVKKIELYPNGAGKCFTKGGIRFFVAFAGYVGAVAWGVLIYCMAESMKKETANILAKLLATLIATAAALWARDIGTIFIIAIIFFVFFKITTLRRGAWIRLAIQFIGMYVLLEAMRAPLALVDGRSIGGGATLSEISGVPEIFWVSIWLAIGVFSLIWLWRRSPAAELEKNVAKKS